MSERNLYHFLDVMKYLGAPIEYSKLRRSYYYSESGHFSVRFKRVAKSEVLPLPDDYGLDTVNRFMNEIDDDYYSQGILDSRSA